MVTVLRKGNKQTDIKSNVQCCIIQTSLLLLQFSVVTDTNFTAHTRLCCSLIPCGLVLACINVWHIYVVKVCLMEFVLYVCWCIDKVHTSYLIHQTTSGTSNNSWYVLNYLIKFRTYLEYSHIIVRIEIDLFVKKFQIFSMPSEEVT